MLVHDRRRAGQAASVEVEVVVQATIDVPSPLVDEVEKAWPPDADPGSDGDSLFKGLLQANMERSGLPLDRVSYVGPLC